MESSILAAVRINTRKYPDLAEYIKSLDNSEIRGYKLRQLLQSGYEQLQQKGGI